jgi:glycosyltransferase involved in cell wall biosynthesis
MEKELGPRISLVMATYNRASTLPRAIDSVIAQSYRDWELVVVDDGSTDTTSEVLAAYSDSRIRVIEHERNRGALAAKNTGLDSMRGEWFTFLDSDDEIVPEALRTLVDVLRADTTITAITCNCIDSVTGRFSGQGLEEDQYLDMPTILRKCRGEYWGITRTDLLGDQRLDEEVPSGAFARLWYPIYERSRRYYVHKGLRIYHTEGLDRVSRSSGQIERLIKYYRSLQKDTYVLGVWREFLPERYFNAVFHMGIIAAIDGRRGDAWRDLLEYRHARSPLRFGFLASCVLLGKNWSRWAYAVAHALG